MKNLYNEVNILFFDNDDKPDRSGLFQFVPDQWISTIGPRSLGRHIILFSYPLNFTRYFLKVKFLSEILEVKKYFAKS